MLNVLVAVDLCDHSPLTLEVAWALAKGARGRVTVVHVVQLPSAPPAEDEASYREWERMKSYALVSAETTLRKLMARIGLATGDGAGEEAIRSKIRLRIDSSPLKAILSEAEAASADLIVVGEHEAARWARRLGGGTGPRLQRRAHVPVITVRSGAAQEAARILKGPRRTPIASEVLE